MDNFEKQGAVRQMEQKEAADAAVAEQNRQAEERRQSEERRQQMVADQRSGKTEEESVRAKIERLAADRGYTGEEADQEINQIANESKTINAIEVNRLYGDLV